MVEDFGILPMMLAIGTLIAVVAFALIAKKKTQARRADDDAPKSTLAADAPDARREPAE